MSSKFETPIVTERFSDGNPAPESADLPIQNIDEVGGGGQTSRWAFSPMIATTFVAFVLLTLTTFSLPFIPQLYFLRSSQAGGVRFGIWGWCLEQGLTCSDKLGMGYTWEPEVNIPITKALALYPVAAISSFMTLIAFIPVMRAKTPRTLRVLQILTWISFTFTVVVFVFMIAMWSVADERFKAAGWRVRWGPLPWMSFIAALLLMSSSINAARVASFGPHLPSSDLPFLTERSSTTAGMDERTNHSDPEKAYVLSTFATSSSSSPLENAFPLPILGAADLKQESSYGKDHDEGYTSRSSDEIDGKQNHR